MHTFYSILTKKVRMEANLKIYFEQGAENNSSSCMT